MWERSLGRAVNNRVMHKASAQTSDSVYTISYMVEVRVIMRLCIVEFLRGEQDKQRCAIMLFRECTQVVSQISTNHEEGRREGRTSDGQWSVWWSPAITICGHCGL